MRCLLACHFFSLTFAKAEPRVKPAWPCNAEMLGDCVVITYPTMIPEQRRPEACAHRVEETAAWVATAAGRQLSGRRQEKENMAAFLAKKREIFLVQVRSRTRCLHACLPPCHADTRLAAGR